MNDGTHVVSFSRRKHYIINLFASPTRITKERELAELYMWFLFYINTHFNIKRDWEHIYKIWTRKCKSFSKCVLVTLWESSMIYVKNNKYETFRAESHLAIVSSRNPIIGHPRISLIWDLTFTQANKSYQIHSFRSFN